MSKKKKTKYTPTDIQKAATPTPKSIGDYEFKTPPNKGIPVVAKAPDFPYPDRHLFAEVTIRNLVQDRTTFKCYTIIFYLSLCSATFYRPWWPHRCILYVKYKLGLVKHSFPYTIQAAHAEAHAVEKTPGNRTRPT